MSEKLNEVASDSDSESGSAGWFSGRTNRKAYWLWLVAVLLLGIGAVAFLRGASFLISLGVTILWIRRLHDLGRTGWWAAVINIGVNVISFTGGVLAGRAGAAVGLLPYLAAIVALGLIPGQAGANAFGPPGGGRTSRLGETFS